MCAPQEIGGGYDYSVDSIATSAPGASEPSVRPITGLQLPAGGFAVSPTGTMYAAVTASVDAAQPNTDVRPQLLRFDPGGDEAGVAGRWRLLGTHLCHVLVDRLYRTVLIGAAMDGEPGSGRSSDAAADAPPSPRL